MERRTLKVGTLTFHMAHNYGAMLQAYALPIAVRKLGIECEVIDYRLDYIDNWSRIEWPLDLIKQYGIKSGFCKIRENYELGLYDFKTKRTKFAWFQRKYMLHSQKRYVSIKDLPREEYDSILFGSDQIWNENLTGELALEYFGDIPCSEKTRKIAYAASNGRNQFPNELMGIVYPFLSDFYQISTRERGLAEFIAEKLDIEAVTVLDPTMLLTQDDWNTVEGKVNLKQLKREKYLFLYTFEVGNEVYDAVRKIASEKKLKIVSLQYKYDKNLEDMIQLTEVGPREFLTLIKKAEFVCASSFHGTVFSILYHKQFVCFNHPLYGARTSNLLDELQLQNRIYEEKWVDEEIDYTMVDSILEKRREESYNFLNESICGV